MSPGPMSPGPMSSPGERSLAIIRPKLAWRFGPVVVAVGLLVVGRTLGAVVLGLMVGVFAFYAWTANIVVFPDRIEKRTWSRAVQRVTRPVTELDHIQVNAIARRAIEIGPMGANFGLELGFWGAAPLRALVRELIDEAEHFGDDESRQRLLRYAKK